MKCGEVDGDERKIRDPKRRNDAGGVESEITQRRSSGLEGEGATQMHITGGTGEVDDRNARTRSRWKERTAARV